MKSIIISGFHKQFFVTNEKKEEKIMSYQPPSSPLPPSSQPLYPNSQRSFPSQPLQPQPAEGTFYPPQQPPSGYPSQMPPQQQSGFYPPQQQSGFYPPQQQPMQPQQ